MKVLCGLKDVSDALQNVGVVMIYDPKNFFNVLDSPGICSLKDESK